VKITDIKAVPVSLSIKGTFKLAGRPAFNVAPQVFVKIETDEGIFGIGETNSSPVVYGETQTVIIHIINDYLKPALVGMNPILINPILDKMDEMLYPPEASAASKAAIDVALYDLCGKILNVPVHVLLGGKVRDEVESIGGDFLRKPEENAEYLGNLAAQGYTMFKVKLGSPDPEEDIARIRAVRKAIGEGPGILADANEGYPNAGMAIKYLKRMEEYNIDLAEQPVKAWDITGLKEVKNNIGTPVLACESLVSPARAIRIIKEEAADVFNIKLRRLGGIRKAVQVIKLAEAANIPCHISCVIESGVMTAAMIHLAAAMKNVYIPNRTACVHLSGPRRVEDIVSGLEHDQHYRIFKVPDGPGLGIELTRNVFD
jgi:L-alanine-DL-glutamate epimerase-like enolase superfamily enzyme